MKATREEEMAFFCKLRVYDMVPRDQPFARTRRAPIRVKWVDINKGSEEVSNYWSRLVAAEIAVGARPDLFAGTPPPQRPCGTC